MFRALAIEVALFGLWSWLMESDEVLTGEGVGDWCWDCCWCFERRLGDEYEEGRCGDCCFCDFDGVITLSVLLSARFLLPLWAGLFFVVDVDASLDWLIEAEGVRLPDLDLDRDALALFPSGVIVTDDAIRIDDDDDDDDDGRTLLLRLLLPLSMTLPPEVSFILPEYVPMYAPLIPLREEYTANILRSGTHTDTLPLSTSSAP
jgi:hypothetical protein